jgi:phage gpG-like protein
MSHKDTAHSPFIIHHSSLKKMKPSDFFRQLLRDIPNIKRDILRDVVAVESAKIHAENFRLEQFSDTMPTKWPARKKADKNPARRALLVQSGTLRRHAVRGGRVRGNAVEYVFPLDYERVHNEGGQAGRGKGFTMPRRQYVGESDLLKQRIEAKARQLLNRRLQGK